MDHGRAADSEIRTFGPGRSILFLTHNFRERGTYFRNLHLARALAARGWRVTLWTVAPERRLTGRRYVEAGVTVWESPHWMLPIRFAESGLCPWNIAVRALRAMREFPCVDVLFVSDHLFNVSLPFFAARGWSVITGRPFLAVADWADLFTMGGLHERWSQGPARPLYLIEQALEIATKRHADAGTVTSKFLGEMWQKWAPTPTADQVLYLPSGCAPDTPWWAEPQVPRAQLSLAFPPDTLVIGRLSSGAGVPPLELQSLLAIGRRYQALHDGRHAALLWIGPRLPAPEREALSSCFVLQETGFVPPHEVPLLLGACDLFVMIEEDTIYNRSRGPIRLTSYLAAGRPVALRSLTDSAADLAARQAAVLWDDPALRPDEIDRLLTDRDDRFAIGREGRAVAETTLSWPILAAKLEEHIERFIK